MTWHDSLKGQADQERPTAHRRRAERPHRDADTPNLRPLSKALSGPMTAAKNHKIKTFFASSLAKTVSQRSCPLSFLTFHRTRFTARVKWPSAPQGGTGRGGVGRLFWGHNGSLRYFTWRQRQSAASSCRILSLYPYSLIISRQDWHWRTAEIMCVDEGRGKGIDGEKTHTLQATLNYTVINCL